MNNRSILDDYGGQLVNDVQFNRLQNHFSIGLEDGFAIFSSETGDLHLKQDTNSRVKFATMLESSQIVGFVQEDFGGIGLNRFILWDTAKAKEVAAITAENPIISARLTKQNILLVFEREVTLYKHQPKLERVASYETGHNPTGVCSLGNSVLAIPGRTPGQIRVFRLGSLNVNIITAHTSSLKALALSPDEAILVSASATGTLLRVHAVQSCARLAELRRGLTGADIYSLAISPSSTHLVVTSDTNTLHVFKLPHPKGHVDSEHSEISNQSNIQKWAGLAWIPFAPRVLTDVYSFATAVFDPGQGQASGSGTSKFASGIAGWIDDELLCITSAGPDARYERFALTSNSSGISCIRVGWSRYMRPS